MKPSLAGPVLALAFVLTPVAAAAQAGSPGGGHHFAIAGDVDILPGEIAVDLRDDTTAADRAALVRDFALTDLAPNGTWSDQHGKIEHAHVAPERVTSVLEALARDPRVEHAEPMSVLRATFIPNDPMYADQWHLTRVGAERAWDYSCGMGARVAVIDTGVACFDSGPFSKGTDLKGTRCGGGWNFVDDVAEAHDDEGHGTHVAGTVAQTTHNGVGVAGLAHCARLMPVKVLNEYGWGTVTDVAEGIRWAADNGAQVLNLSLGGNIRSRILQDAVRHALRRGAVVVAAAGNSSRSVLWPAAYPGVLAVSASNEQDGLAWFSSRGPEVFIAAPGVRVTQQTVCNGGHDACELFGVYSGTSMSSPHVAGAAAILVSLGVTDRDALRTALATTAFAKGDPTSFGAGLLDAGAAAARVHWKHVGLRSVALIALALLLARHVRRRGGAISWGTRAIVGALLGGVGVLPFAPLLGVAAKARGARWVIELAMRPFGEWDLVLGAGLHRWLPLANAVPTIALTALFFGFKGVQPLLGGFALGNAALLAQLAWSAEVAAPFGSVALRAWTIMNALVCLWIARVALDRPSTGSGG